MSDIQTIISNQIQQALEKLEISFIGEIHLEHPGNPEHGEWSSNVAMVAFKSQSEQKFTNPRALAEAIVAQLREHGTQSDTQITNIEVAGPGFINFYLHNAFYVAEMGGLVDRQAKLGNRPNEGKLAIVEFSSPNIAKPFTIGHLRSTIIGAAVANLLEVSGYKVLRDNHLGDWGTQFGKLIYAIKHLGVGSQEANIAKVEASEKPVKELVELYVEFHAKAEEKPELEDEGRAWFTKLENGDAEARKLWQMCIDWSWQEFNRIYEQLGISFSPEFNSGRGLGESFFEEKMAAVIRELEDKKLLAEGEKGAKLVFFPDEKYPPAMILKKDGSTLYATRDLATDKYRKETYDPDLIVNEVGAEQALYFRQLFEIEQMLGWYKPGQRVHVKHGLYRFKDGKMSTRKGNVIWLEDVLREAVDKAYFMKFSEDAKGYERGKEFEKVEAYQASQAIGIGALKWNDLRRTSDLDVTFDWNEILNMDGNSGPYLQYTYARAKSVLRKGEVSSITYQVLSDDFDINPDELAVLRLLSRFEETVLQSAEEYAPHQLCTYLFNLAQAFNAFYAKHTILGEAEKMAFRLQLTQAVALTIQEGLRLLGIETVEEM